MTTSEMFRVTADDGVELQAEIWPGRDGAPVVIGLHGLSANRKAFLPVIAELGDEVTLVSLDQRGRCLSDKPEDVTRYGHRRNADDAAAVLRHLGAGPVVVIGQSMGAWIGLQLAAHRPELVSSLVLVDGGFFGDLAPGDTPDARVERILGTGWLDRMRIVAPKSLLLAAFQAHPAFQGWWSPTVEELLVEGLEDLPDGMVRSRNYVDAVAYDAVDYFRPFGELPYVRADLSRVTCPVVFLHASSGFLLGPDQMPPMISAEEVEQFRVELPQLEVIEVPDSNHYSINFGPVGMPVISECVRKALA